MATLLALAPLSASRAVAGPITGTPPYPQSTYITQMTLDWSKYHFDGWGSDNWPTTWAKDGSVYTSWGDGGGFGPDASHQAYVSIGFARLTGSSALTISGVNLIGGLDPLVAPCFPVIPPATAEAASRTGRVYPCRLIGMAGKTRSVLAIEDQLYAMVTPGSSAKGYAEARFFKAPIGTNSWQSASWAFTIKGTSYPIIYPAMIQAGQNHADQPDYVYMYGTRYAPIPGTRPLTIQKGPNGGEITLLRAPAKANLLDRASWSFYAGSTSKGPTWNAQQAKAKGVFFDPNGVGWIMSSYYVKALNRYFILTAHTIGYQGLLGVFEAPQAWGPWHTVFYSTVQDPAKTIPLNTFFYNFLANSFSVDGKRFTLVFAGHKPVDGMSAVDGSFTINPGAK